MQSVKPFLKWPGGKRWLVPYVRQLLAGREFTRYLEPFLGGGAMFFGLRPAAAVLADINADLVNVYAQVKSSPESLLAKLRGLAVDETTFRRLRDETGGSDSEKAVRFLYLNRTAFAGMYRLNKAGQFNVPYGGGQRTPTPLWRDGLLNNASAALTSATVQTADFAEVLATAQLGDLVYCDPTYTVAHNNNGFVRYNESNFSWQDQTRLAKACAGAVARGATVMVSNASHDGVRELYPHAEVYTVSRWSGLSPKAEMRTYTLECLFILGKS